VTPAPTLEIQRYLMQRDPEQNSSPRVPATQPAQTNTEARRTLWTWSKAQNMMIRVSPPDLSGSAFIRSEPIGSLIQGFFHAMYRLWRSRSANTQVFVLAGPTVRPGQISDRAGNGDRGMRRSLAVELTPSIQIRAGPPR
jgi:hypothetical protein